MLNHYVKEFFPGSFVSETVNSEIKSREDYQPHKNCYAYQFYDVIEDTIEIENEKIRRTTEPFNITATYYFGTILTIKDVEREQGTRSTLYMNMKDNRWERVVKTKFGGVFPLRDGDIVL